MRRVVAALAASLLVPLAACGGDEQGQTVTVLAAASLTEAFTELAADFEDDHPGVEVELVLGSSTTLAEQAVDGAPGDVLATADEQSMRLAEDGGALADEPDAFAGNRLTLVTPPEDPAGIDAITDLDDPDVDWVRCSATAPCGAVALAVLDEVGVESSPASEEVDVKAVLARVTQGEADAGLVYRTDAVATGDGVREVAVPEAEAFSTNYFVAPLDDDDAERGDLATQFVTFVRSAQAREVLERAGFSGVVRE